jgi:acetoin utilization deacetylase AcuC-like enzyme
VQELVDADAGGGKILCPGTRLSPGSWAAALLAACSTQAAMQYLLDGHGLLAYALVRPPGHHAQPTMADGYCFLNNAGLAVQLAVEKVRGFTKLHLLHVRGMFFLS